MAMNCVKLDEVSEKKDCKSKEKNNKFLFCFMRNLLYKYYWKRNYLDTCMPCTILMTAVSLQQHPSIKQPKKKTAGIISLVITAAATHVLA